jgi:L-threonylcarbamoyladenylate synthase
MLYWNDAESKDKIKKILDQDEILFASGDTVLGLWGKLTEKSFESINQLKQRSGKPYLIVIASISKIDKFVDLPLSEKLQTLIQTCWPGPVTIVFKARADLPAWMKSPDGTIALRVPDHAGLLKLLADYDGLFSTSANIQGQPIPESLADVDSSILSGVGTAVCIDRGQQHYGQNPSTILDCSTGNIRVLRLGAFDLDALTDILA